MEVFVERSVVNSILSYAQIFHPRESILLLEGKAEGNRLVVNDVQIPPLARHGNRSSGFPLSRLPIDFSVIGVAHSHPSGIMRPSFTDLNKFYGKIMLVTGYPYENERNITMFDQKGHPIKFTVL